MGETNNHNSSGKQLLKGATILAVAGIVCKVLGAIFRIPLTNWIGAEGMSYYGVAYPVYSLFLVISSAGIPVAISRMVSSRTALGEYKNAHKTFKVSIYLMLVLGVLSFACCFFGAGFIADKVGNSGAKLSLMAIAPALLFVPIVSSFVGYYQGQQNMNPTAVSQVIEQLVRVGVGLGLSYVLVKTSLEQAAAGATFGASAGIIFGLVVVLIYYFVKTKERKALLARSVIREESNGAIFKEMLKIAIPITLGSTIMPLMMIIDSAIVMNRMQATGWTVQMSKTMYGLISGFCDPLVNMPIVFVDAMAISLLPAVTRAFALKRQEELENNIRTGMKTMMVIAFPCAVGLIVLAKPILYLLYPMRLKEADMAVSILIILSVGVVTLSFMRTLSSALQGIGKVNLPVIHLFIGALCKSVITFILVGIPAIHVNGAAFGSTLAYFVAGILNYASLKKYTNVSFDVKNVFVKPCVSSLVMGAVTFATYYLSSKVLDSNTVCVMISMIVAVIVYFVVIFKTDTLTREEALLLPAGNKIVMVSDKLHLTVPGRHYKQ